jgi:hypothetical protein
MSNHAILTSEAHRDLRVSTHRGAEFGDDVMCCMTVPAEFRQVQNEYPILFRMNAERNGFSAFALFGFENGENLFLDGGRWAARYRPLAMDIQPFLIGRSSQGQNSGQETGQVHIDLGSARIAKMEGTRVFDELGRPTPYLETIAEKLGELDEGYRTSGDFFATLMTYNLLEPLALDITLNDGAMHRFVGFHVIHEERLRALPPETVAELHAKDYLMPIYMALASLSNIGRLVERKNKRLPNG